MTKVKEWISVTYKTSTRLPGEKKNFFPMDQMKCQFSPFLVRYPFHFASDHFHIWLYDPKSIQSK